MVQLGSGFARPAAVAVDSHGNVFVADATRNQIDEIPASNGPVVQIGAAEGNFNNPQGIAVDTAGNVFVSDTGNGAIKEILVADGYVTVKTLIPNGTLSNPSGIAVDADENIFIANVTSPAAVFEALAADNYATIVSLGSGFHNPVGIAIDSVDDVYVSDPTDPNHAVKEIVAAGGYQTVTGITTGGIAVGQIAIDINGNLYVGLPSFGTVIKITPSGGTPGQGGSFNFGDAFGIAVDASGNIYVANENASTIPEIEAGTTTALGVSPSPSTLDGTVTLTATITASAGAPSGSVTFFDGGASLGQGTVVLGVASLTTQTLDVGTHSLTATYGGDLTFAPSISTAQSLTINAAGTSIGLTSSANPSVPGQSVTFTASVPAIGGTVSFQVDSNSPVTVDLIAGQAVYTTSSLSTGSHSVTASYSGSTDFGASISGVLTQIVSLNASTTSVISSVDPSIVGQSVTFTAFVGSAGGTPIGSVTFLDGSATLGSSTLVGGVASFTTSALGVGGHPITARYGGDSNFASSTSAMLNQSVSLEATATSVVSSLNPSIVGQPVTFTAFVSSTNGTPTGSVTFKDGSATLGTGMLSAAGIATLTTSGLAAGNHSITANYGGSAVFVASASAAVNQVVNLAASTTSVVSSLNPSIVGQPVTFTAFVSSTNGTPTGSVTFGDGSATLGTGTLSAGIATLTTSGLAAGNHSITANYGGSGVFIASASSALSQTVNPVVAATTVIASKTLTMNQAATPFTPVTGSGGTPPLRYSISPALPAGLTLNPSTGAISGTPSVAANAASYTVTVTDAAGATASASFTLAVNLPSPTVTGVSPDAGPPAGGTTVTINGTNLTGATAVSFGAAAAAFTVNSATSITATSPAGSPGTVDVTVTTPGGTSAVNIADRFAYTSALTGLIQQGLPLTGGGAVGAAEQGHAVALSGDGSTAVVGGFDDNAGTGAVWVFNASSGTWTQQGAKLVGSGAVGAAQQGWSVALSADGSTLILGGNMDGGGIGAAWIFVQSNGVWAQQGPKVTAADEAGNGLFGAAVALSADGNTAVVGGNGDNGGTGAAWIFTRSGGVWTQQGSKLVGTGAIGNAAQGASVALSGAANIAVVGGAADNNGNGAAWVYAQNGGKWTQQGEKLVGGGAVGAAQQGGAVALSSDGSTLVIGGSADSTGIGAAWIFAQNNGTWVQQGGKLIASDEAGAGLFGGSVALSNNGSVALIGGSGDSASIGAAWVFAGTNGLLIQQSAKLVGTGAAGAAQQGFSVSLSTAADIAIVGGPANNANIGAAWIFQQPSPLLAAVIPESRSVQVGSTATVFATIINTSGTTAPGCSIAPSGAAIGAFAYETTNPTTNTVTGTVNTPIDIAGNNTAQSFIIALTPAAPLAPTNLPFIFACANVGRAPTVVGLNTLLLSASTSPVPDIVALAASADPGIVDIPGANGTGVFAVATINLGASSTITASANTQSASLPVSLAICQTIPATGACMAPQAASVTATINAFDTPTFAIFASGSGSIAFDPANSRVFVQFNDPSGAVRGATSVGIRTQ